MENTHALIGREVEGRYRVVDHIADGGMGSVFVAHDERLKRDIALKVLRADLARNPSFVDRFRGEAQAAAQLNHPNVVAVHDQGRDHDVVFLAMELVRPGRTLRDLIRRGGLRVDDVLTLMDHVAAGLACAHRAGLVHRDIKPENVLISSDGDAKVADFGLARAVTASGMATMSDALLGTAPYLAPEQVAHGQVDPRSDVYATGLVMFEMLTGTRAFDGDNPVNVAYQHVHASMPQVSSVAAGLGEHFDSFFAQVCAKDPNDRPQNADELRSHIRQLRMSLPQSVLEHTSSPGPQSLTATAAHTHAAAEGELNRTAHVQATQTRQLPIAPEPENPGVSRRVPLIAAGVVGLSAAAAAIAYSQDVFTPKATVPNVTGKPQGQAVSTLRQHDLSVRLTSQNHDTVKPGTVISSTPTAGQRVPKHSDVSLAISSGPRQLTIPDLRSMSPQQAERKLKDLGFSQVSKRDQHDRTDAGKIIGTQPIAGTKISHLTPVVVLISKGPKEVEVPDLADTDAADARRQLESLDLKVAEKKENHDSVEAGKVIDTSPGDGTKIHAGDTVTVRVSKGPEQVEIPDVVGMSAQDAISALEDAGFEVEGGSWTDELFDRTVTSQDPQGGSGRHADKGSTVTLSF